MIVSCRSFVVQQPLSESQAHSQLPSNKQFFSWAFGVWGLGFGVWRLAFGRLGIRAFECLENGVGRWATHSPNLKLVWTLGLPPSLPFPRTGLEFQPVWETGVRVCCLGLDVG